MLGFITQKMLLCSILKNYGFPLTSASQAMQLNAVGCTSQLTQMSKDLADDISSMAGAQE